MGSAPEPEKTPLRSATPAGFTVKIEDAYRSALKTDEGVAIRREAIERTFGDTMVAAGEVIGDVHYIYTDSRQDSPEQSLSGADGANSFAGTATAKTRSEGKFTFNQPIFQGFKEFGVIGGAGALRRQRVSEKLREEQLLLLDVADAFYGVLEARRDVKTIEDIRRLFDDRIQDLGKREKIGRSRPSEISSARSRMKTLEADYASSRGTLSIIESEFEYLTGIPSRQNNLDDAPVDHEVTAAPDFGSQADARVDVIAAKASMETAKAAVLVAQSDLFPHVGVSGNLYQKREGFQKDTDWDILMTIDAPLFTGGTTIGLIQRAASDYRIARLMYQATRRDAILDLDRTRTQWLTALERQRAFEAAVKAAEENFNFQTEEYGRSLVSNLDVLEALEILLDSRRDANKAFYETKRAYWRHRVATSDLPS